MKQAFRFLKVIFIFALLSSCGTSKNLSKLVELEPSTEKVEVLGEGQNIPPEAQLIGNISINDTGITTTKNCTYNVVIEEAITFAKQMGGNVIYITSHTPPSSTSGTCHQMNFNVYKVKN